jgi:hypothetical protein
MADYFREMFESLKQTAEGLIQANEGIKRAVDAALAAKNEHEDLRETVLRLEGLVLAQGRAIRALRDDLKRE